MARALIGYAGSFRTRAEALERRRWVDGELAAMRVPDLCTLDREPVHAPTLLDAVAAYRASRIDIAEATRVNIGTSLSLILGALVGQRLLKVTSDTYMHVLIDSSELDYAALLARA
jgi:hypothetical protein